MSIFLRQTGTIMILTILLFLKFAKFEAMKIWHLKVSCLWIIMRMATAILVSVWTLAKPGMQLDDASTRLTTQVKENQKHLVSYQENSNTKTSRNGPICFQNIAREQGKTYSCTSRHEFTNNGLLTRWDFVWNEKNDWAV